MKTKYFCQECDELFEEKDIAFRYQINVAGKYPVWEYICKDCDKKKKKKKY